MGSENSTMAQSMTTDKDAAGKSPNDDPFRIGSRYIPKQARVFPQALQEIQRGQKSSHWMWYVIPTPPYVVNGVERGSGVNSLYALRDLPPNDQVGFEAARAYLQYPEVKGVNLRKNYVSIISAVGDQLEKGISPILLMGHLDDPKLRSSVRLFEFVSREDPELQDVNAACSRVLKILKEEPMPPAKQKKAPSQPAKTEAEVEGEKKAGGDDADHTAEDTTAEDATAAIAEQMEKMRLERMKQTEEDL